MFLETARLILRPWQESDKTPFAALNADEEVMRYFPVTRTRAESDDMVERLIRVEQDHGFTFAPVERKSDGALLGMVGLLPVRPEDYPFGPTVEIGWRFAKEFWGHGYATEAASAWLDFGFNQLNLPEIVAFTAALNLPSQKVMQRLGMTRDPVDDFDHPRIGEGHPLQPHVLYRSRR